MTELLDIYDAQKTKIGTGHPRYTPMTEGHFHFVVTVVVSNAKGELLLQQRQTNKKMWPSRWDYAASGAVKAGETLAHAAQRELKEELGIERDFTHLPSRMTLSFPTGWNEIYFTCCDVPLSALTIQADEVQQALWADKALYNQLIDEKKFIPYIYARQIYDYIASDSEYLPN